jgi:CheY-like chemotaxis protein
VPKAVNKAQIWAAPKENTAPSSMAKVRPLRILLAEDNDINALLALSLLNRDGHKVVHAKNGLEAVNLATKPKTMQAKQHSFDLILMDIHMPDLDGLRATRAIRKAERLAGFDKFQAIPIIALTANAFKEDKEKCLAAGMTNYLSKPIDPEVFHQMIAVHVINDDDLAKSTAWHPQYSGLM